MNYWMMCLQTVSYTHLDVYKRQGRYHYVVVEHAGAYNQRCNTCIIADLNFVASIHYLISGTGRSAICLNYNGCNIYTLHCESGSGAVGDIRDLVRHAVSPFIIGGDMNSTPSELSDNLRIMTTGTRSRPVSYTHLDVYKRQAVRPRRLHTGRTGRR